MVRLLGARTEPWNTRVPLQKFGLMWGASCSSLELRGSANSQAAFPKAGPSPGMQVYASHFPLPDGSPYVHNNGKPRPGAPHLLGTTPEIEELRPKSPPR